jgi:hypothetical protein
MALWPAELNGAVEFTHEYRPEGDVFADVAAELREMRGFPHVDDFFATYCPPVSATACRASISYGFEL